jgi:hypothetical protein
VPAAAVIPAPIAYIKVVAVKKLVVEIRAFTHLVYLYWYVLGVGRSNLSGGLVMLFIECGLVNRAFTLNKLECLKQALQA